VSLCLARKYIYGQEICRLSVGPLSLNERALRQSVSVVTSMCNYYDPTVSAIAAAPT
jgi:hypothetical protein